MSVRLNLLVLLAFPTRFFFETDGIDVSKPSNEEYLKSISSTAIDFPITLDLRNCEAGESFSSGGKCEPCPANSSYALVVLDKPGECYECPTEKAYCYGGNNMGPKAGYWRKNSTTYTIIKCLNQDACLGISPPDYNPMGDCGEGYQGYLCADCIVGYSRTGDYECGACPNPAANFFRLAAILIAVVIALILLVRSTFKGAREKKNVTSIYTKIMMNHLQLIMLTSTF